MNRDLDLGLGLEIGNWDWGLGLRIGCDFWLQLVVVTFGFDFRL